MPDLAYIYSFDTGGLPLIILTLKSSCLETIDQSEVV